MTNGITGKEREIFSCRVPGKGLRCVSMTNGIAEDETKAVSLYFANVYGDKPECVRSVSEVFGETFGEAMKDIYGGSGGDDKLVHAQFKIDSVTQDGVCEHVSVQATPKNLAPGQGSMSATKMFYTEIDMKQVKEGEVACAGEAQSSRPLGTGIWEFKVRLASGPSICERDIQLPAEGQPELTVSFKDGDTGCT